MKPKLCWDCANLGKCQNLKPCNNFIKFNYPRESEKYSIRSLAKLMGVNYKTILNRIGKNKDKTLNQIRIKTGYILDYIQDKSGKHKFVEI